MRKGTSWLVIVFGSMALGLSFPSRAPAQTETIVVDPGDDPLVINGRLDGQATTFSGNVRLTATEDVISLMMLAEDLRLSGPDQNVIIARTNIAIGSGIKLSKDQPQDVRVTVSHVAQAGEYYGKLTFLAPGKPEADGRAIKLRLRILRALEGTVLRIEASDSPLVIKGTVDKNTSTFNGYVRVTASGGDVGDLQMQSSDLQHKSAASVVIERSNVTIAPGTRLARGVQREVRVIVANVKRPGQYTGQVQFLLPGEPLDQKYIVPLQLNIDAEPDVIPMNENLAIQLVRTGLWNRCESFLARRLLGESVVRDALDVQLNNQTLLPVQMLDGTVVARGEKSGHVVGGELTLNAKKVLPENQIISVPLMIHRNELPADRYTGTLRFKVKDSVKPVTVNLDLSVREGPLLPLLVVVFGIIFGRLARSMETPTAKMQVTLLPRFYNLQDKASVVSDATSAEYLAGRLRNIRKEIEAATLTEQNITSDLDKLEIEIEKLASLQALTTALQKFAALRAELGPTITQARTALINGQVDQFDLLLNQIQNRVQQAQQDGAMGGEGDAAIQALSLVGPTLAHVQQRVTAAQPPTGFPAILANFLAVVSGTRMVGAGMRYWLFRPLLYLTLLLLLALLGLQTLYVNAGATFGASGVYDYLGLFLWGISADVAQRIMQVQH